jgi:hypothetical protein
MRRDVAVNRLWLFIMAAGAAIAVTACSKSESKAGVMTAETLKTDISAALPGGSSVDDVIAYLDSRKIEHSSLIDQANMAHMGFDPNVQTISAIIRNVERKGLVTGDLTISFRFDRAQKLSGFDVKSVYTGP